MAGRDMYGELVHLEVSSTDLHTTAGVFKIYNAGRTEERTLKSTEYLTITDIIFHSAAGGTYTLAFDAALSSSHAADAGTWIAKGTVGVTSGLAHHFETPRSGPIGVKPKLLAAAGQVDCVLCGYIQQS
jgi:hypothetical protein